MRIDEFLSRLKGVKKSDSGWIARCPAHDDHSPSLSVSQGDGGKVLVRCFAGCSAEAVVAALGLTLADLMGAPTLTQLRISPEKNGFLSTSAAVAALESKLGPRANYWTYTDRTGEPVGLIVRWNRPDGGKDIRPVSRNGTGWKIGAMDAPRPLYQLPELADASRVFVCEGEKAAEAAASLGLTATTSAGGSQAARLTDWLPLTGKDVMILRDNDSPGEKYAHQVAEMLHRLSPPARVRIVRLPDLPEHGDVFDFIEIRRATEIPDPDIRAEIERLADAAEPVVPERPELPERFRPFLVDALPEPIRRFVEAVADATGTDPSYAALAALVTLAGCVGNRAAALVRGGWIEPAVLWGAIVGRSGATKSPVIKLVSRPLIELYKVNRRAYTEALKAYEIDRARYDVEMDTWRKSQRSGPATDPPEEPERPRENRVHTSDVTMEKLGALLDENPMGMIVIRDELAAWLGSFDRYAAGGKGSDRPNWLSFYDAAPVTIDRKSGGSVFIERAAVSVLGSIQPGTLQRLFGLGEREAGLLARILPVNPPERPAKWHERDLPDAVAANWKRLLETILSMAPATDDIGDPRPRLIPIGPDAKPIWAEWHDRHAREILEIVNDDLEAHFAKLKGIVPRLGLIFTVVKVANGDGGAACIDADSMRRAIAVAEWFKSESRRIYGMLAESVGERERRRFVDLIRRFGGTVTPRDVQRASRAYRTADEAEAALEDLAKLGYGRWEIDAHDGGRGRPARRFRLHDSAPDDVADSDKNTEFPDGNPISVNVGAVGAPEIDDPEASSLYIPEPPATMDEPIPESVYLDYPEAAPRAAWVPGDPLTEARDGWTAETWHAELLRKAKCCQDANPERAAELRAAVAKMEGANQ